ncbi:MAG: serine/threonine-protein phosphatase [Chloroflexi bacterium]|nr:serine/threonine-protein phosphatase [Chloroflexota bacterium]
MSQSFIALRDRGRQRHVNQDQAVAERLAGGFILLAVADGVGGARAGEVASEETILQLVKTLRGEDIARDTAGALSRAIVSANERVYGLSAANADFAGMATTLVAALVREGEAWVANVGDSRAYLCSGGRLRALTEDDSWVMEQVRSGALSREEAERSPFRNAITRGIGVEERLVIEAVESITLAPGDVLLLCSDGLYRMVDDGALLAELQSQAPEQAGKRLIELANQGGGIDNIGIAVYRQE